MDLRTGYTDFYTNIVYPDEAEITAILDTTQGNRLVQDKETNTWVPRKRGEAPPERYYLVKFAIGETQWVKSKDVFALDLVEGFHAERELDLARSVAQRRGERRFQDADILRTPAGLMNQAVPKIHAHPIVHKTATKANLVETAVALLRPPRLLRITLQIWLRLHLQLTRPPSTRLRHPQQTRHPLTRSPHALV